jgi:2-polyprenyl-6-methoxyphenol hydroxylase-like FAD-dependent oxidoreductase
MSTITVLGGGFIGLTTGMLLARDGHRVTVLERDPAAPTTAADAWDDWERPGVGQFRQLHFMLSRWRQEMQEGLPEALDEVLAAGAVRMNPLALAPAERRGPLRPDDDRFETVTARRPVLEAGLAAAASRTPGLTVRRGVGVTGFVPGPSAIPGTPHVSGVHTADGEQIASELVVDCRGRRSRINDWLLEIGGLPALEERAPAGFVYYGRHFRSEQGTPPEVRAPLLQHYAPFTLVTLPADRGIWSVGIVTSSADHELRALREPAAWEAALATCPLAAHWGLSGPGVVPITGVEVMAGLEDRRRRLAVDGMPIVTGLVGVGDAYARTNPALGRGTSIGAVHARTLQHVLRETDVAEAEKVVLGFADATAAAVDPMYEATKAFDTHRLAELAGEIDGRPYETDDPAWAMTKAVTAAALSDPDALRMYFRLALLLEPAESVFADPALTGRVLRLGASAPRYPLPGPSRGDVLAAIGA